jgi:HlyD family secretion protein
MAIAEQRRASSIWIWTGIVAAIAAIGFAIHAFTRETTVVRVAAVTHQNLVSSVSTNGKVEPVTEYQAHPAGTGIVANVYVEVDDHVEPGTLLVRMEDADARARLAAAQSSLAAAEAGLHDVVSGGSQEERNRFASDLDAAKLEQQQATRNLAAARALQLKGAESASEVAAAQLRLDNANAALAGAQIRATQRYGATDRASAAARLADARANLAAAQHGLSTSDIRSPIEGTVYSVPVSQYDFVHDGDDLLDVADLNHMQIRAYFDEPDIGKLQQGQPVKIVWDGKPLQTWHGHILRAPTTVIPYNTRSVGECLITVDDAKGDLLPNTNVTVTVTTAERDNVLSIPREALHTEGVNNYFVYRVIGNKLVRTPVKLGLANLVRAEIVSGLTEQDTVALNAVSNRDLADGLTVKPVE